MADKPGRIIEFLSAVTGVSRGNSTMNTSGYVYAFVSGATLNISNVTTSAHLYCFEN